MIASHFRDTDKRSLRENGGWMADRMSDKVAEVADRVNYGKLFLKRGGKMADLTLRSFYLILRNRSEVQ